MPVFDARGNLVYEYNPDPLAFQDPRYSGGSFGQAMNSPYAAMFSQALGNLGTVVQGGIPQITPYSAMQDVRKQNQVLMDNKYQRLQEQRRWEEGQRLRDLQVRAAQQEVTQSEGAIPNPYQNLPQNVQEWELSGAKARGVPFEAFLESKNPRYTQPTQPTSVMQNFAVWRQLNPPAPGEPPEAYAVREQNAFAALARASSPFDLGGGGTGMVNPLTGRVDTLVSPEIATRREATLAGATEGAKNWGKYDAEFAQVLPGAQESLNNLYNFTEQMLNEFEGKDLSAQSGLIQGRFGPLIDETAGYIDTMSSILTVPALAEAKLAPVTVQEWEAIKSTFVNFKRDPAANIGALKAQLAMLRPKIALAEDQWKYYQANGTMEGYARGRTVNFPKIEAGGGDTIDIGGLPND